MKKDSIKSANDTNNPVILGQFEGMCADAEITNENGLDITREVWETVFASDLYKQAIELGWYIGYLGHPDDPNAMTFQDACIVMREGHIDDDGKVYGTFDLIDTPVGRIVKTFIDAGVTFGISVRGAGDIIANSVDPETFVFRGFDLVSFPAYKEAIPTFSAVAASTDVETQQKYKAVCAAVKNNLQSLTTAEAIDIVQEQFAPQSEEYALLEDRRNEIAEDLVEDTAEEELLDIKDEQLEGVMQLYLDLKSQNSDLKDELVATSTELKSVKAAYQRKFRVLKRITAAQAADAQKELARTINNYQTIKAASSRLKTEAEDLRAQTEDLRRTNLKYKQRIEATTEDLNKKDSVISALRSELNETVTAATDIEVKTSNLDAKNQTLQEEIKATTQLLEEYQNAYASLYASVLGVHPQDIRVTSTTSVKELQNILSNSLSYNDTSVEPTYMDVADDDDPDDLVTL